jgi:acyl dehydratase
VRGEGGIVEAVRHRDRDGGVLHDDIGFSIDLIVGDDVAARITNRWRFRRGGSTAHPPPPASRGGQPIPSVTVSEVDADRMKTMAALLRDPYPIHWDVDAVRAAGLGERPVNQGPLNLGYVANMLMAWAGEASIRRLTVAFHGRVFAGDTVHASGEVVELDESGADRLARCAVRLARDDTVVLAGSAVVALG